MSKNKLGQYFNIEAVKLACSYISNPKLLKPDIICKSIVDINLTELKEKHNITYILFDKDNTLTIPYENNYPIESYKDKINEFKTKFGENNIAVISNSCGSQDDRDYKEAVEVEKNLQISVIKHAHKKPYVYEEIKQQFPNCNGNLCIIGDRLLVDITMGKKYNFFTILVSPIDTRNENFIVKFIRKIENKIIKTYI
jgi:phosphatidylglycerophosphatase GEP4